ncbi:MAG: GAF domain-containing protein [Gaiellaceae bacterium]
MFLNAIPLLALAWLYVAATIAVAPSVWKERGGLREVELAPMLAFPCLAVAAGTLGILVLFEREPIGGNAWVALLAILWVSVPGVVFLVRSGGRFRTSARKDQRAALSSFAGALVRTDDPEAIARLLLDRASALLGVPFAALTLVDGNRAQGVLARVDGRDVPSFRTARLDLASEPSATASAAFEAAPVVVFDVATSPLVKRRLEDGVDVKSAAFVPLVSGETVIAVLTVGTTGEHRAFGSDDLATLQELAAESALALDRTRSVSALGGALERERLVAEIARKVRSELDVEAVLRVAVEETGRAIGCMRCFVRLGEIGEAGPIAAEWDAPGVDPIGEAAPRLPVINLAVRERRTAAVGDILRAPELEDPTLGSVQALVDLGTRAVLATPIIVFDSTIGVLGVHRPDTTVWSADDVSLVEAVAQELGLAVHTARLLEQNERRLGQDSALLQAAQAVTSELEPALVLQRLVDEVAGLLRGDAADCYLLDPERRVLRCAAVHGLTPDLVGFEFPADRGLSGEALARGRPVIAADYERVSESVPNPAYAEFSRAIVAPVIWSGEPRGVLGVGSRAGGRAFDETDGEVLEAFASLASLALRNAEAFEERSRQARVQRGFYRIASVLARPLSLAATLDAVAQAAAETFGGDFAAVLMPRASGLELAGAQALPQPLADTLAAGVSSAEAALHAAAAERRVLAAPSVAGDDRFELEWQQLAEHVGYRSLLAIPVESPREHETSGLGIVFFAEERRFSDDDLELADQLASAARGALDRSALYEEERRARSLAQQLARMGSLLATELDPAAVLEEVVRQAPSLGDVEACVIRVLEGEELVVSAAEGEGVEAVLGARSPATGWLSGDVIQSRAPLALADAGGDERLAGSDPLLALGYRAFLGVPLVAPQGGMHGVLAVYARRPKDWREEEVEALLALAANASAALSNAELYQRVTLAKEQADAILSNIADGIVAVDREGSVVLWNSSAEQITGVPAKEAVGRTPIQVLGRNLETGGTGSTSGDRLVSILRSGEEVWLSLTEAIMRDPAGAVAGRIYAFRDISTDRLVEELKSEFVSTVSQKLRRPLTSIYGFAETLLRRDVLFGEEERSTFLGYIASESERLTTIVDELLNVAQLDAGDLQVNLSPIDVGPVLSEVVASAQQNGATGHEFVVDIGEEPLAATADRDKLRQVLSNLVDNAVKYSPGGGTVTVAARRRGGAIEVSVADQGIGIPHSERQRIFRKFYRADSGASREGVGGGTGLGLFIAEGLVKAMGGGRIEVESSEGEGSTFTFELPPAGAAGAEIVTESEKQRV